MISPNTNQNSYFSSFFCFGTKISSCLIFIQQALNNHLIKQNSSPQQYAEGLYCGCCVGYLEVKSDGTICTSELNSAFLKI